MCIGNRASSSAYYINKQFETLWQISNECVAKHGHGIKPSKTEVEYGSCLAQLCIGKHNRAKPCKEDLSFFASFGAPPQLQFICNHEAVLKLQLKSGHYKLDGKSSLEIFEGYTCSFRLQYREHLITDTSYSTFGQTEACKAKLLILDLNSASFIREFSTFANGHTLGSEEVDRHHRSIVHQLSKHYLPLLRKAGFHCIYSLPDFDSLHRTHHIDYSVISEIDIETYDIFGINIDAINTFMTGRWLESAACVDELEEGHDHSLSGEFALAEHRAVCDDISFHAFFGPPQIRALCSKEVIFYIDVQDLHFYMDGGFHGEANHQVSNWKIAVVVEVHLVEEEEGCIRRLRLDFSKSRFCESRSICGRSETMEDSIFIRLRTVFIQYITQRYLFILEEFEHHHIYRIDVRVVEIEDYSGEDTEDEGVIEFSSEFRERLCITDTFGYDILTSITQGSINDHLRCLWKASQSSRGCLASWAFDQFFGASFGPLQIQFPCDSNSNTVIIHIDLREGFLTNLGHSKKCIGGEKHEFAGWKLAFDVDLKHRDYRKAHAISDGCLKGREKIGEYIVKQLFLDFSTLKFRQDLSRLPGLFERGNSRLMRSMREALLYYISHFYLAQLKREGHHVLYSIPIWKQAGACEAIQYAASSFAFQFFPAPCGEGEQYVSSLFGHQRNHSNRNMLVICGMVNHGQRPGFPLPRCSWSWSSCQEAFSGMFALSRSIFLEGWLLVELGKINGRTTLVPKFHGIGDNGEWKIELVTWNEHPYNADRFCGWKQIEHCEEGLQFEWKNRDEWTYDHQGDACDIHNGGYSVSCKTTNSLVLPTASHHGVCKIELNGRVDLKLAFKGGMKNWSTKATARWSATISLAADAHGGGLTVTPHFTKDIFDASGFSGNFDMVHSKVKDSSTLLREQLEKFVFVEESTIYKLQSAFSGVWPLFYSGAYGYTLGNPVFNSCGDLLFELIRPVDRQGRICVPTEHRRDLCLPSRTRTINYQLGIEQSSYVEGETSMLTSTTGIESPIRTPPLDHALSYSNSKIHIREEDDVVSYGEEEVETVYGGGNEKVHHAFDGLEEHSRSSVAEEY